MLLLRRLLIPALLGALVIPPLLDWLDGGPVGWPTPAFFAISTLFAIGGILTVGLPAAQAIARRGLGPLAALPVLLVAGVLGGAAIAVLTFLLISGEIVMAVYGGQLGLLPGAITALLWFLCNIDRFRAGSSN